MNRISHERCGCNKENLGYEDLQRWTVRQIANCGYMNKGTLRKYFNTLACSMQSQSPCSTILIVYHCSLRTRPNMCSKSWHCTNALSVLPIKWLILANTIRMDLSKPSIFEKISSVYLEFGKYSCCLAGFVDSNFMGDLNKTRSLTSIIFNLRGCAINWKASLQIIVFLPTAMAEFMIAIEVVKEAIWLLGLISKFAAEGISTVGPHDSLNAIQLNKDPKHYKRMNHIISIIILCMMWLVRFVIIPKIMIHENGSPYWQRGCLSGIG